VLDLTKPLVATCDNAACTWHMQTRGFNPPMIGVELVALVHPVCVACGHQTRVTNLIPAEPADDAGRR
jgi:hypothetical protein